MKDDFGKWFFQKGNRTLALVSASLAALAAVVVSVTTIRDFLGSVDDLVWNQNVILRINLVIHTVLTFFVFVQIRTHFTVRDSLVTRIESIRSTLQFRKEDSTREVLVRATSGIGEFLQHWKLFWFALFFLYLSWLTQQWFPYAKEIGIVVDTTLNNFGALMLFYCYRSLSKYTIDVIPTGELKEEFEVRTHVDDKLTTLFAFMIILFAHIVVTIAYQQGSLSETTYDQAVRIFTGASGVLFSVSLALVIGRLDSKYINAPMWIVVSLYFYAAIQPLFILFADKLTEKIVVLYLGLGMKIIFLMFILWLIRTGRLLYYYIAIPRIHDMVSTNWSLISEQLKPKESRNTAGH